MSRPVDTAYLYIKEKILNGTFKPSQKLNEIDLANEVGVSRNTVKIALLKLQQEQLVEVLSNKGANVKSYTIDEIVNYLEIREVLEVLVAVNASSNITDQQIEKLSKILRKMEEQHQNNRFEEYSKLNKVFHQVIYDACSNKQAVEMINIIKTQLARFQIRTLLVAGRNRDSYAEHMAILESLKSRDGQAVANAIKTHISNVRKTIQENSLLFL